MSNKDYTDEIKKYENEANTLSNDEEFHSKDLSEAELSKKTPERNYYIEFKDDEGNVIKKIYVDRHDYILYKRPIWAEWKREQLAKRCLIPNDKGGYKRCMNDCSLCNKCKNGTLVSLDSLREDHNFEPTDIDDTPLEITLIEEAKELLWSLIRKASTDEQYNKVRYRYKDGLSLQAVGDIYGVSHKAIEKTINNVLKKVGQNATDEERDYLIKYILK